MSFGTRYISRSGYETSLACERKYYYGYLYAVGGLDTPIKNENFTIGLALHAGMERFFKGGTKEESLAAVHTEWREQMAGAYKLLEAQPNPQFAFQLSEWEALSQAMFIGWQRVRAAKFLLEFEPLLCEQEVPVNLSNGVVLQTRADLVVRSRRTGHLFVINWKTRGPKDLFGEYSRSIQMWTEALAVEDYLGEPVAGVIAEGFYKGTKKNGSYNSPLIWGYENHDGVWSAKYVSGWNKVPMWIEGKYLLPSGEQGLEEWIAWMPQAVVEEQFMQTPPILKDNAVVRDWLKQVVQRETDLTTMLDPGVAEADRLQYFFQRFGKQCGWCPFDALCQQTATPEAMLEAGLLVKREDHHAREEADVRR